MIVTGGAIFIISGTEGRQLLAQFSGSWPSLVMVALATLMIPLLWISLKKNQVVQSRIWAGGQITLIILGIIWNRFPVLLSYTNGHELTVWNTKAPEATLQSLTIALVIGSLTIFPSLYFLLRTFSKQNKAPESH